VTSISPSNVKNQQIPSDFDLLFISIHAFNELTSESSRTIMQWKLENIFVDEYHNVLGELFKFSSSWQCLRLLASLNVKIMLLSATSEKQLMSSIAQFMNIGDYVIIGSESDYPLPDIRIHIIANEKTLHHDSLFNTTGRTLSKSS
jgi:superfamily II DNA helicase RecQ